jgi:hypothetical protein
VRAEAPVPAVCDWPRSRPAGSPGQELGEGHTERDRLGAGIHPPADKSKCCDPGARGTQAIPGPGALSTSRFQVKAGGSRGPLAMTPVVATTPMTARRAACGLGGDRQPRSLPPRDSVRDICESASTVTRKPRCRGGISRTGRAPCAVCDRIRKEKPRRKLPFDGSDNRRLERPSEGRRLGRCGSCVQLPPGGGRGAVTHHRLGRRRVHAWSRTAPHGGPTDSDQRVVIGGPASGQKEAPRARGSSV